MIDTKKRDGSDSLDGLVGEVLDINDVKPPNDDDYPCIIVFDDGYEAKSDGSTVCKSTISTKWRKLKVVYLSDEYRNMTFNDEKWIIPND